MSSDSEAVDHAEESLAESGAVDSAGGNKTWKRGRRPQVARHCNPDDAAQLYLWSAVAWAQWGRAGGAVDAVRHGMAAKLNDYAQRVIELDPHRDRALDSACWPAYTLDCPNSSHHGLRAAQTGNPTGYRGTGN